MRLDSSAKPTAETPDDLAYWLREFDGDSTPADAPENLFPPGYGDDLLQDE
jgi:hypothetical protein